MNINIANIELELIKKINYTDSPLELLSLSAAIKKLKSGIINVVFDFSDLPLVDTVENDSLWLVKSEQRLYHAVKGTFKSWKLLDTDIYSEVWAWGINANGNNFGNNCTNLTYNVPVQILKDIKNVKNIYAGNEQNLLLNSKNELYSWGANNNGQLGDGTNTARSSPVSVVGGFSDWISISNGFRHVAAIRSNGTLWTWGINFQGQLGDETTICRSSPVSVVGGFTDWCQVSAGASHTAAIRTDGTLWTWGCNTGAFFYGTLGDNTDITRSSPVSVVGGFTDWCGVSAGYFHSTAIRTNGTIWSWGFNQRGQSGNGCPLPSKSPISVVGGFTDWCGVTAGREHTVAIRTNGTLWSWGWGASGQLGNNNIINHSSPVSVVGGFTDWCLMCANGFNTAAIRTNGTLWTWGSNSNGQLGDGTYITRSSPVSISNFSDWTNVSHGGINMALRKRIY